MRDAPIVVIGATSTSVRLVEELEKAGVRVVVLVTTDVPEWMVEDYVSFGAEVVQVRALRAEGLRRAEVPRAETVVVLGQDDVEAMRLALLVEELNPGARLLLEMSNPQLSGKLSALLGQAIVLSSAALAAPSFVSASLADGQVESFEIAGRLVVAGQRSRVGGEVLAVLGDSSAGTESLLADDGDIVLGTEVLPSARPKAQQVGLWGAVARMFDRRVRWVMGVLVVLMVVSTVYFHFFAHLDWWLSMYAALTSSTLTGIGDIGDLSLTARFGAVVIQLFGLVLSSGVTAVIVDALISARLSEVAGGLRGRPRHHVVLCGLGRIGGQVALRLKAREVPVVAIERNEESPGVQRARAAGIPVVIADASDRRVLEQAGIRDAASVLAVTDNDAANLEIGLVAQQARPDVRVVTRVFDHELADRVEHRLKLGPTRSVSMLAAPVFAAAALGHRIDQLVPVGRRVMVLTELTVGKHLPSGPLDLGALRVPGQATPLAVRPSGGRWTWADLPSTLTDGDVVAIAASRLGLADLLADG
ncbi:NAD-binding protein [Aestuariimicrobium soli]|uniref:NAD-binding protein n=1 Tax=Aestuariimicrobium soli TaxID=2035834 RepID=UPI003EB7E631